MAIEIGQTAPDFSLKDQSGNDRQPVGLPRHKAVALVFYPFTFTGVCEGELCQLRDDFSDFERRRRAGAGLLAATARFAQKQWAEQQGYQFPVLSDFWPHGEVAKAYGVFNDALRLCQPGHLRDRQGRHRRRHLRDARPRHGPEKSRYEEALPSSDDRSGAPMARRPTAIGSELAHHRDDLAEHRDLVGVELHRLEPRVGRQQHDLVARARE